MTADFTALEYNRDGTFSEALYSYEGGTGTGWTVKRNGALYLETGPGYRLMKTVYCGICSTDLSRNRLPFPLPQVLGHEVAAEEPGSPGRYFVVEINDSHAARGDKNHDAFCASGLQNHCPERMVLGIDRLPGGFGGYFLAPVNAVILADGIDPETAVLIEPFAAALHALDSSRPAKGGSVAVLGTGRLGLLIIAALAFHRNSAGVDFRITAIGRHGRLLDLSMKLGADAAIDIRREKPGAYSGAFDTVFDASGTADGLDAAIRLAPAEIHLKSTNGLPFHGLSNLTGLVVDELSILPLDEKYFEASLFDISRRERLIFDPSNPIPAAGKAGPGTFSGDFSEAAAFLRSDAMKGRLPRFDACIARSPAEIDMCIRPEKNNENSLARPCGTIFFRGETSGNPLLDYINSGGRLKSSRCGDFRKTIGFIKENSGLFSSLKDSIITHEFPVTSLPEAFRTAGDSSSIKVVIRHN
ncbi:MAG: alcohol dehydrogenase catalytic domain-containing protein [Spirochaetes bacterium]|jgi:threonine dehydrogenase-like Zn-dependent dehydrogenase|nr:alcohol dehydrogenase catalytic domain-containing protein [Spirochaetota bacterium]